MSIDAIITGSDGDKARVTPANQLITAPYAYDRIEFRELAIANDVYNFYYPKQNWRFVITAITAKADKQVSSTVEATVVVYETADVDSSIVVKVLWQDAMVEGDRVELLGLNIRANAGVFINAKTTDDDIHMNIMGYFLKD